MFDVAEREGFEPSIPCRIHDFQSCALDRTMRPLRVCDKIILEMDGYSKSEAGCWLLALVAHKQRIELTLTSSFQFLADQLPV